MLSRRNSYAEKLHSNKVLTFGTSLGGPVIMPHRVHTTYSQPLMCIQYAYDRLDSTLMQQKIQHQNSSYNIQSYSPDIQY